GLDYALEYGTAVGPAEGRAEGLEEGRAEGRAEGRSEAMVSVALKMKQQGMDPKDISRFTGLSLESIQLLSS
ncbi:MAG: hypothetical protein K2O49_07070, partial [Muribaculaceae bacterium]|nr:hypothetical protein [Muribaculaceae bacterium]